MFKFIKGIVKNNSIYLLTLFSTLFVTFSILFPAGAFSSSSLLDGTSEYLAEVTRDHTQNGKYLALKIEDNGVSEKKLNDNEQEFVYLYGRFGETRATYTAAMNSEKEHDVYIDGIDNDMSFSFLHNDHGNGSEPYNGHYKQTVYPLELMFRGDHLKENKREQLPNYGDRYVSFIYLSESVAKKVMPLKGIEFDQDNPESSYNKLLGKYVGVIIDGTRYYYWIENIYLEINYFYKALTEVMGDFLFCAGYPKNAPLKKQALFFLRNYSYQNKFYLDYVLSNYSLNDFKYDFLTFNIKDGYSIDNNRVVLSYQNTYYASVLFLVLSIVLLLVASILVVAKNDSLGILHHIIALIGIIIPYAVFSAIFKLTNFALFFSSFSTQWYMVLSLLWILFYLVIIAINFMRKKGLKND